ncbi:MAG: hypothetical protein RL757_1909 [Bacteroidota bacterium]|jgi:uridine phosphorylase
MISPTDVILNADGSVYHLGLLPHQIAETIIFVGDPERVGDVSKHFDKIEVNVSRREFVTHTGYVGDKKISVISTGIGADNVEIVLQELDLLVNFDFETREFRQKNLKSLHIIRIGTSGSIQENISINTFLISKMAVGMDNLMNFYDAEQNSREYDMSDGLTNYLEQKADDLLLMPYAFEADKTLFQLFEADKTNFSTGCTLTAPGFYAPQGRKMRGKVTEPKLLTILKDFKKGQTVITNLEMETAAIYGMARLLGHRAVSLNAILANRVTNEFSETPKETVEKLIEIALQHIVKL